MTDLERFAAVLLAEWQQEGHHRSEPIVVGSLLDRTLPYRTARRLLGVDVSEDYEMLVLRLLAEEGGLVRTDPPEAAEAARETVAAKVPDLEILQRLRSAAVTLTDDAVDRLEGVRPMPTPSSPVADDAMPPVNAVENPQTTARTVFPIRRPEIADATATAAPPVTAPPIVPPPAFLTGVAFSAPDQTCWSCGTPLPSDRVVKFCVGCGVDQRQPTCDGCGSTVERDWSFCPECGGTLG